MIRYSILIILLLFSHTANALVDVSQGGRSLTFYDVEYIGSNEDITVFMVSSKINNTFVCYEISINHPERNITQSQLPYCIDRISGHPDGEHITNLEVQAINVLNAKLNKLYNINVSDDVYKLRIQAYKNKPSQSCEVSIVPEVTVHNENLDIPENELFLKIAPDLTIYVNMLLLNSTAKTPLNKVYEISICQE